MLQFQKALQRSRQLLDGQWSFWQDPKETMTIQSLTEIVHTTVSVPSPWQSQSPELRNYSGVAWYQCTFDVENNDAQLRTIIGFDAVDYLCEVWINGIWVGEHEGGYLPFEFDISDEIQPGENTLSVRVTDSTEIFPEVPHGKQSWYGMLSGIWQSVWIEKRPEKYLQRIKVTPIQDRVEVEVQTNQPLDPDQRLVFEIFDPDHELISRSEAFATKASLMVSEPRIWDLDTPNLYTIKVSICSADDETLVVDRLADTFGFRTIATEDGRILLNGRPIYLRGALDQDYYPDLISTAPSMEYILNEFRKAKEMGLNCLRVHIKVADPRYYYAADQLGLLIWTELPSCRTLSPDAIQRLRDTVEGMFQRDWNHPSIVIWTIINESWGTELHTNPDHRQWLSEMYAWVKRLDPTRIIVDNSPCFPNFHVQSDLDDFHFYAAIPDNSPKWDQWIKAFASRAAWIYGRDKADNSLPTADHPAAVPNLDETKANQPPLVVSEFGNWGLPDVNPLLEHYHGEPWWFDTGWDWGNGIVHPHAALQRFNEISLDKAFGTYAKMAEASQWSQFDAMKYEIESMRKQAPISGYIITEFTDLHWEANGLLDMLRNEKIYHKRLTDINTDTMILPEIEKHAFWSQESVKVSVSISHYGKDALNGVRLKWVMCESGADQCVDEGVIAGIYGNTASLIDVPAVNLTLPKVIDATQFTIHFTLLDAWGDEISHNQIYFTVFPPLTEDNQPVGCLGRDLIQQIQQAGFVNVAENPGTELPLVTDHLDSAVLRLIQQGARVVFLAETPADLTTEVPGLELKTRKLSPWDGDWVGTFTWLRKDLFNPGIPGDGHFDLTYASVVPETVIASTRTQDFDRLVWVGLFSGWLRKPVGIVQKFRIGKGELIVSTLKVRDRLGNDPIATLLIREMIHNIIR